MFLLRRNILYWTGWSRKGIDGFQNKHAKWEIQLVSLKNILYHYCQYLHHHAFISISLTTIIACRKSFIQHVWEDFLVFNQSKFIIWDQRYVWPIFMVSITNIKVTLLSNLIFITLSLPKLAIKSHDINTDFQMFITFDQK